MRALAQMETWMRNKALYNKALYIGFILCIYLLMPYPLYAQGPPVNTNTAIITGLEGAALRSFVKYMRKSGPLPGGKEGRLSVMAIPVIVPYEVIPNKIIIIGSIPYLEKHRRIEQGGNVTRLSRAGPGDFSIFLKYLIYQKDAFQETTRAILMGGIKFPTGDDNRPGLPQPMQLGSGAFDYTGGFAWTYVKSQFGINIDMLYTIKTEANNFEFGDTLRYDLALGWRLIPAVYTVYPAKQVNLYLELNGTYSQKNRQNNMKIEDSGGNIIFISPGIQFILSRTFLVEASFQVPLSEDLNGSQMETDYAFLAGFRWLIY